MSDENTASDRYVGRTIESSEASDELRRQNAEQRALGEELCEALELLISINADHHSPKYFDNFRELVAKARGVNP